MKNLVRSRSYPFWMAACLASISCHALGQQADPATLADLQGGLVVQLGASDTTVASGLSLTGRYLVHLLDPDKKSIDAARTALHRDGHYGLAWAERFSDTKRLPYAENVVNLVIARDFILPDDELLRALTPGGTLVVANLKLTTEAKLKQSGFEAVSKVGANLVAKKPWPKEMDQWSHPRHAADGNAVSGDTLVGPPERIRWIAAATSEVEGMVSAGGRNFYGGILARDSFNGLRLWHRNLRTKDAPSGTKFDLPKLSRDGARPIASPGLLFAVMQNRPVALDTKTGEVVVEFGEMTSPTAVLHDGTRVVAADETTVRAYSTENGKELWKVNAPAARNIIGDGKIVSFVQGNARRGEKVESVALDALTGKVMWRRSDYAWLIHVTRTVLAKGQLVFEVSSLSDHDAGNAIHVVSAKNGEHRWSKEYAPGMNHQRQARAMFLEDDLWILHGGKVNTADEANRSRQPTQVSALDPLTGKTRVTHKAGLTHCFPPVATPNFLFAGEFDLTNLKSGDIVANRITKANCSRENGWVPANGLVYTTPKHCTCWPMLRGFVAMAPAITEKSPADLPVDQLEFPLVKGHALADPNAAQKPATDDWSQYRHDRWRSGSTAASGPTALKQRWSLSLQDKQSSAATGPILSDWQDNPIIKGPVSAPTIAQGIAYVTRPHAHELVAIDVATGKVRWRFSANGRLDTPPTIHRGVCLIGSAAGRVYGLRADTGEVIWTLRAAPNDQRIVAHGQVESPWPVPGSVLVIDDVAYFAAGRQPLADGGILVFAINPMTGDRHWVQRIDSVPQKGFYENSGLEFDPFDILHAEGDGLAMSRWILTRDGKNVSVDKWNAFAKLNTGGGEVWIPRGSWTYGARHQHRFAGEAPRRPLVVFRDDNVYSSLNGTSVIFRRDFDLDKGEKFNSKWITGWAAASAARKDGTPYRTYRIAEGAKWNSEPFAAPDAKPVAPKRGTQLHNRIFAMALDGKGKLYVAHQDGRLKVISTEDGNTISQTQVPPPAWDGLAIANGCLFLTTKSGELLCLGE